MIFWNIKYSPSLFKQLGENSPHSLPYFLSNREFTSYLWQVTNLRDKWTFQVTKALEKHKYFLLIIYLWKKKKTFLTINTYLKCQTFNLKFKIIFNCPKLKLRCKYLILHIQMFMCLFFLISMSIPNADNKSTIWDSI